MDPDANVAEQADIRKRKRDGKALPGDSGRLRDLREALAAWLANGNCAPKGYRR